MASDYGAGVAVSVSRCSEDVNEDVEVCRGLVLAVESLGDLSDRIERLEGMVETLGKELISLKSGESTKKKKSKRSEAELEHERQKEQCRETTKKYIEFKMVRGEADFVGRRASVVAGEVIMFAQMSGIELCTERGCKTVITNTIKETCGIAMHNGMFVQKSRESYDE